MKNNQNTLETLCAFMLAKREEKPYVRQVADKNAKPRNVPCDDFEIANDAKTLFRKDC